MANGRRRHQNQLGILGGSHLVNWKLLAKKVIITDIETLNMSRTLEEGGKLYTGRGRNGTRIELHPHTMMGHIIRGTLQL